MARYTTVVQNTEGLAQNPDGTFSTKPVAVAAVIPDTTDLTITDSGPRTNKGKKGCVACAKQPESIAI